MYAMYMDGEKDLVRLAKWVRYFALTWNESMYYRSGIFDHEEVSTWLGQCVMLPRGFSQEESERTARVMRKLRRMSVREYEVMYRLLIEGNTCEQVADWLNERARVNEIELPLGRSEHYRRKDVLAMLTSATEWCLTHW